MNKQTATRNLDEIITKVEGARLRISEHHIVKIIGISKYSNKEDTYLDLVAYTAALHKRVVDNEVKSAFDLAREHVKKEINE